MVFSTFTLFFYTLFGIIVRAGMVSFEEGELLDSYVGPYPNLFAFAGIALAVLIVALLFLGSLEKKPSKTKAFVLTSLSFVVFAGGLAASIVCSLILNVGRGIFVTVGYIEFFTSLLYLIALLINGVCLPILIKKNLLYE